MNKLSEDQLIFIISQPRAGSTLLQAILSNNHVVDTISEHWMLLPYLSLYKPTIVDAKYDYTLAADAFWDFIKKWDSEDAFNNELKMFLLNQYAKIRSDSKNKIIDKTPRYYEIFDEIYNLFPQARYIILKRHPIAVLRSMMKTWDRFSFNDLYQHHYRDVFKAPFIIQSISERYKDKDNCIVLKYEDLLRDPGKNFYDLYKWLDIPYNEKVLNVDRNTKFIGKYGDPTGIIKSKEPDAENLNKWKKDLTKPEFREVLSGYGNFLGAGFLRNYGYDDAHYGSNIKFSLFKYCSFQQAEKRFSMKYFIAKKILRWIYKEKF